MITLKTLNYNYELYSKYVGLDNEDYIRDLTPNEQEIFLQLVKLSEQQ